MKSNYAFEVKRSLFSYDCIDVVSINVTLVPNCAVSKVRIRIGRAKKRSVVLVLEIFICVIRSVVLLVGDDHILNLMPVESMIVRNDRSVTSADLKVDDAYVITICRRSLDINRNFNFAVGYALESRSYCEVRRSLTTGNNERSVSTLIQDVREIVASGN